MILSDLDKKAIIDEYINIGTTQAELAKKYKVNRNTISKILKKAKVKIYQRIGLDHPNYKGTKNISSQIFSEVAYKAKKRKLSFNITIHDMDDLLVKQNFICPYTKRKLTKAFKSPKCNCSLDRIDSSIGYEINNIQWVYKKINSMKNDMSHNNFIDECKLVAKNSKK